MTTNSKLNAYLRYPAWSPLGNQIAYEYSESIGNIWLLELGSMSEPQRCNCGKALPEDPTRHFYRCECGRLWLRPDCSEECAPWSEY